ncbi:MAG: OadG family protein [Planctomycetota bacterium]|jgi:Na+-transporting methylmalonyl-CoA/oxaloacetate decarboxylase gamma subunit|nr:OadG family protein [Planctomycetota bacterium]
MLINLAIAIKLLFMGVIGVMVFLGLMVWVLNHSGNVIAKYAHLIPEPNAAPKKTAAGAGDEEPVAVALAAIRAKG